MSLSWLKIDKASCSIEFTLSPTQVIKHEELSAAVEAVFDAFKNAECGTIRVSGRGPVWLYAAVVHTLAHLTKAVLVFDAISKAWVVVVSHSPDYPIGKVITDG